MQDPLQKNGNSTQVYSGWVGSLLIILCQLLCGCDKNPDSSSVPESSPLTNASNVHYQVNTSIPTEEIDKLKSNLELGDIDTALESFRSQSDTGVRQNMLTLIIRNGIGKSFENLAKILGSVQDNTEREIALSIIATLHANANPKLLFENASTQLTGNARNRLQYDSVHAAIQMGSAVTVRDLFVKMPYSRERTKLIGEIAIQNYRAEGLSSLQWVSTLELDEDILAGVKALVSSIQFTGNVSDMEGLASFVKDRSLADWRVAVDLVASMRLKTQSEGEFSTWLSTLNGEQRDRAIDVYIRQAGARAGDLSEKFNLAKSIKDQSIRESSYLVIAAQEASRDPVAAAHSILALSDDFKATAIPGLVYSWYDLDSEGLSDWIISLPRGNDRDIAIVALTRSLGRSDPNAARQAASSISDERLRAKTLNSLR